MFVAQERAERMKSVLSNCHGRMQEQHKSAEQLKLDVLATFGGKATEASS
jgi:hypothetical protein